MLASKQQDFIKAGSMSGHQDRLSISTIGALKKSSVVFSSARRSSTMSCSNARSALRARPVNDWTAC